MLRIDYETYSECDIKEAGAWMYSRHPSTEVLCMAYAKDDEPVQLWLPGDPLPDFVKDPTNCGGIEAHNAGFEISIWRNVCQRLYGFAEAPLFVWHDSMAKCGAHALPLSLEKAADALHIMFKKDMQGSRIMLQLAQPRIASKKRPELRFIKGVCQEWDEKFERLYAYCKQDVEVQRAISKRLAPLTKRERNYWLLTEAINLRGIHLDMALVKKAQSLMQDYVAYSKSRIAEITNGELTSVSTVAKLLKYLQGRGVVIPNPEYPKQGEQYIPIDNLRSATLESLLDSGTLDEDVISRECVQLRLSTGKSSTAKLNKMMTMSDTDDRVRHNYKYYGATTGRMCIAEGQLVKVKDKATAVISDKPIEQVLLSDLVWDGHEWVSHEGVDFSGVKSVISYGGLVATPEHKVYISDTQYLTLGEAYATNTQLLSLPYIPAKV